MRSSAALSRPNEAYSAGIGSVSERMLSFRPVTSRLAARVFGQGLFRAAERTIEIAPASSLSVDLPIMLADEPSRIKAHHAESSPERNIERLTSRTVRQGPTRMHLLRDVIIADGAILARRSYDRIAPGPRRWLLRGEFDRVHESALCSTYVTQKYFGHWLRDGMSHELLASDQGLPALVLEGPIRVHEEGYRQLLSLRARKTNFAHCDRLWVLEDCEQNAQWIDRYQRLRKRIRTAAKAPAKGTANIFLARGDHAQGRGLSNRQEVRSVLRERGWTILEPEKETPRNIARILANARMVLAPEGSALAHAALAAPTGTGFLTIIGAQHFNMPYKGLCDSLGMRFGLTIADPVNASDFEQPIDRLLQAIDLMDGVLEKQTTR